MAEASMHFQVDGVREKWVFEYEGWRLEYDGTLIIRGPNYLDIVLKDFDSCAEVMPDRESDYPNSIIQRGWRCPLESGLWLSLLSLDNAETPDGSGLHRMKIGRHVTWLIPEEVAEELHGLMFLKGR